MRPLGSLDPSEITAAHPSYHIRVDAMNRPNNFKSVSLSASSLLIQHFIFVTQTEEVQLPVIERNLEYPLIRFAITRVR